MFNGSLAHKGSVGDKKWSFLLLALFICLVKIYGQKKNWWKISLTSVLK
jgi:hypothetical protein